MMRHLMWNNDVVIATTTPTLCLVQNNLHRKVLAGNDGIVMYIFQGVTSEDHPRRIENVFHNKLNLPVPDQHISLFMCKHQCFWRGCYFFI